MNRAEVIDKLKELKPILSKKYGLTTLALFGSYSREHQTSNSDIDLLINFAHINANNFFDCSFELQDYFAPNKVEVVTVGGIKPKYLEAIKEDLLYV